jgi:hypothetical protein
MNHKFTRPTRNAASPPFSARHKLPMFSLGNVVATPGALDLLDRHGVNASTILRRHRWGDFGAVCDEDRASNLAAIGNGARRRIAPARHSCCLPSIDLSTRFLTTGCT